MTAAAVQLHLPPPGFCRAPHCTNRVSVANTDGICDECHLHPLTVEQPRCAMCHRAERQPGDYYCLDCRRGIAKRSGKARRAARKPLNLPCACCGKALRVKDTSYCARCGGQMVSP